MIEAEKEKEMLVKAGELHSYFNVLVLKLGSGYVIISLLIR
jgi:hypothetical protein